MVYDEKEWAIFGSISSESTHMILRLALKAEFPIVNSASTDPTIPETYIPWYFTDLQDDRVQAYTLARRMFTELRIEAGGPSARQQPLWPNGGGEVPQCGHSPRSSRRDRAEVSARRHGFSRELRIIQRFARGRRCSLGRSIRGRGILKQMRAMGMKQRVFGAYRTLGPDLVAQAGPAAEGFEAVFPYDPTRNDPRWLDFNRRFEARFHEPPEQFASLAYDAMNILLDSICKAGLNRARIHDALADLDQYDGVTGHMVFDPNQKNVAPMFLGTVHNGAITYRVATMEKTTLRERTRRRAAATPAAPPAPYARVGEDGVDYEGPAARRSSPGPGARNGLRPGTQRRSRSRRRCLRRCATGRPGDAVDCCCRWTARQNWGAASTQLVHALMDGHALAILALDRDSSHLSEQLALKCFVPVVALSDDKSLTSANIPWIFRLAQGTAPADALRLLEQATSAGGANPEQIRDVLASGSLVSGLAFQPTGETRAH